MRLSPGLAPAALLTLGVADVGLRPWPRPAPPRAAPRARPLPNGGLAWPLHFGAIAKAFRTDVGRCVQCGAKVVLITRGPSAELGRGPPQAAWRGAVAHPSGGPSAPGRRCWRLGRKRPSPFFKLGAHSATLRPEFGGPEKFKVLLRKRGGAAAAPQARARSGSTLAIHIHAEKLTVGVVTARGCAH